MWDDPNGSINQHIKTKKKIIKERETILIWIDHKEQMTGIENSYGYESIWMRTMCTAN